MESNHHNTTELRIGCICRHAQSLPRHNLDPRTATTRTGKVEAGSIGAIVGQIKSASSRRINRLRNTPGTPVWHHNYYDHIIPDERDLDRVRSYIAGNPANWPLDKANRKETAIP